MQELDRTYSSTEDRWAEVSRNRLPVLIVMRGSQIGRRYLLNENYLVLGRSRQRADVVIPDDPEISGRHCRIEYNPTRNAYEMLDLGSTNGTRLNGARVQSAELHDGDKLLVGSTIMKFTFQDVIEAEYYHEIDRMMNIDELTGLVVVRLFQEQFRSAVAAALRTDRPLCVLMMDMDGLKKMNDNHGHHVGAGSIAKVGRLLGRLIPDTGSVTRFGGDEFTAFVSGLDRDAGVELGEQIRAGVKAERFEFDGVAVHPTISIGVAALPEDGSTSEQLFRRADEALYRAKAAGRNCVRT